HVEEEMGAAQVHDQQSRGKNCPSYGRDTHGCARKIESMKDSGATCDYGRHSGHSTEEKVKRDFARPDRRFHHGPPVVTGFARNRATGDVHAFARNDALLPRLLAQFFEPLFGWRIGCHWKNANARSVAMIDAIAVANADVHADFR